jgi:hypothetical protein
MTHQLPPQPLRPPMSRQSKIVQFAIGFVGWFLANGGVWLFLSGGRGMNLNGEGDLIMAALLFLGNLFVLLVLAFVARQVALGALSAIALNLLIALILGVGTAGWCFIPVFAVRLN